MPWTSYMNRMMLPSYAQPTTSKSYVDTTTVECGGRAFNVGDLVLHLVLSNKNRHKLSPPWEGPYVIAEVF